MKKLNVTWDGVYDPTGYMFSFAKSLCCAAKNSPFSEAAEDIVASSGFVGAGGCGRGTPSGGRGGCAAEH